MNLFNKKKALMVALAGLTGAVALGAVALGSGTNFLRADDTGVSRHLAFTKDNQFVLDSTTGYYESTSRYVTFAGGNVSALSGGFCVLRNSSDSYIRNLDPINELENVTVTFNGTGSLSMGYSYYDALENNNLDIWSTETGDGGKVVLSSGVATADGLLANARYLYFVASTADVNIVSIDVQYGKNGCVLPAVTALPSNLNKAFNASNRLNLDLPAADYSANAIHLAQGKPSTDATVYSDWLKEGGCTSDISSFSTSSEIRVYPQNELYNYRATRYCRDVNFSVVGKDVYGAEATTSNTILGAFVLNPYVAKQPTVLVQGDYDPFTGAEYDLNNRPDGTETDPATSHLFALAYNASLSFKNVTFKGSRGLDILYGRVNDSDNPTARNWTSQGYSDGENQAAIDYGTDLGSLKQLTLENCTFEIDSSAEASSKICFGVDIKANCDYETVAYKYGTTTFPSRTVDFARQGNVLIKNCRFVKVHDSSKQSSAIYTLGAKNLTVEGCQFSNIDYNAMQVTSNGFSDVRGNVVFKNNAVISTGNRTLRLNENGLDDGTHFDVMNNSFKGCAVSDTAGEGYFKATGSTVAAYVANNQIRIGNGNAFYDTTGTLLANSAINASIKNGDKKYLVGGPYINYDEGTGNPIALS